MLPNPCYYGRGRVYLTPALHPTGRVQGPGPEGNSGSNWAAVGTPAGPWPSLPRSSGRPLGNASGLAITPLTELLAASAWDTRPRIGTTGVDATLTLYGHGGANLALALAGGRALPDSQPVTDTIAVGQAGMQAGHMLFTRHCIAPDQPVTVAASWATWAEGQDWERAAFGVRLLRPFAAPLGATVAITYNPDGQSEQIDALTRTGTEFGIAYVGINKFNRAPVRAELYRATLRPAERQLISDSAGTLVLPLTLLPVCTTSAQYPEAGELRWYSETSAETPDPFYS